MTPIPTHRTLLIAWCLMSMACAHLCGQSDNPVYVDNSPQAWERFQMARDHARDNTMEAVRLLQELLDDSFSAIVPANAVDDALFVSIRQRVLEFLVSDQSLLDRYRDMQHAEADRLLKANQIELLARSRSLTPEGLEALLRLGQRDLEAGHFYDALGRLLEAVDHPDLGEGQIVPLWRMIGLAARYGGDDALFQESRRRLAEQMSDSARAANTMFDQLAADPSPRSRIPAFTIHDQPPTDDMGDLVGQSIWSIPLDESLLRRRWPEENDPSTPAYGQHLKQGNFMPGVASIAGDLAIINQGYTIIAVNRLTGTIRWRYRERRRRVMIDRDTDPVLDMNVVAVGGGSVVTVNGHAYANRRSGDGRIVCLDTQTGSLRWWRALATIGDLGHIKGHEKLFPHGSPVIAEDTVYLLARKVNDQYLTSCYVIALDLADGHYKWSRHIGSSGGLNRGARNLSCLTEREGDLYVATPIGVIARLNGATGDTVWLRRFHAPINTPRRSQTRRAWEISSPVVTKDYLVAIRPDRQRIVVLDRATGELVGSHAARRRESWNSPLYLLGDDNYIFAISNEVRAFRIDALDHPVWMLPPPRQSIAPGGEQNHGQVAPRARLRLRGRVQLIEGGLVIPGGEEVLIVDEETGVISHRLDADRAGNPLAVGSQLMLAGGDRLDMYMSFSRAEHMLRERIAAAPDRPDPALALLRLGLRGESMALILEAAELTLSALNQAPPESSTIDVRNTLFTELVAISDQGVLEHQEQGERLFAILEQLADQSSQRVEFALAYGSWLRQRDPDLALEQYQSILDDPRLARLVHTRNKVARPASAFAIEQIAHMIHDLGPSVRARRDEVARGKLEGMMGVGDIVPGVLIALAKQYPFTPAAVDAVVEALRIDAASSEPVAVRASLSTLAWLDHPDLPLPTRRRLLGTFAEYAEAAGWPRLTRQALVRAQEQIDPTTVITNAGPITTDLWLDRLGKSTPPPPRVGGLSGKGRTLTGLSLVPLYTSPSSPVVSTHHQPAGDFDSSAPTDRALLVDAHGVLHLIAANTLEILWSRPLDDVHPQVLQFDANGLLLWLESEVNDPRAVLLDPSSGAVLWTTPKLSQHLGDPIADLGLGRAVRKAMPDGRPFDPKRTLPLVFHDTLLLIRSNGGMLALDMADGQTVLWAIKPSESRLQEVHIALVQDYGVILAGVRKSNQPRSRGSSDAVPALFILDPDRGRFTPLSYFENNPQGVRWISPGSLGRFFLATENSIHCVDGFSGQICWTNFTAGAQATTRSWWIQDSLMLEDADHRLRFLSTSEGTLSEPLPAPLLDPARLPELHSLTIQQSKFYALYRTRLLCYNLAGEVVGADVINDARNYQWVFPARDRLVLVNLFNSHAQLVPNQAGRLTLRTYRIHQLSKNGRLLGEPGELHPLPLPLQRALLIDGWLLLSTENDTLALPMPGQDSDLP